MIKAWINQMQGADLGVPCVGDMTVALQAGAKAMGSPEVVASCIEEGVALTFKCGLARSLPEKEACGFKPAAKMFFLRLSLGMREAGESYDAVLHQRCMADENHIGQSLLGVDQANVGDALQLAMKLFPLSEGEIPCRAVKIAGHPRIDNVIDVIPFRVAHQVGGSVEMREGGKGMTARR